MSYTSEEKASRLEALETALSVAQEMLGSYELKLMLAEIGQAVLPEGHKDTEGIGTCVTLLKSLVEDSKAVIDLTEIAIGMAKEDCFECAELAAMVAAEIGMKLLINDLTLRTFASSKVKAQ